MIPIERLVRRATAMIVAAVLAVVLADSNAAAQQVDSARAGVRRPPVTDTTKKPTADATKKPAAAVPDSEKPPISPKRAFLYSFMVPGYGQSVLDRPIAGAMFFGAEVTWLALATKSAFDLRYARAHKREFRDFVLQHRHGLKDRLDAPVRVVQVSHVAEQKCRLEPADRMRGDP